MVFQWPDQESPQYLRALLETRCDQLDALRVQAALDVGTDEKRRPALTRQIATLEGEISDLSAQLHS
jgi:hypothetical protein